MRRLEKERKMNIEVGQTWRFKEKQNQITDVFHIRGIVDGRYVVRYWNWHKQRWDYDMRGEQYFRIFKDLIEVKK